MAKQESLTGKIDWITVIIYVILSVLGWLMIHSASTGGETVSVFDTNINSGKQFQWMIASFILAFVILIVDSRFYTTFAYVFYVLLILFVVAVMAVGTSVKGQQNWIRIGGFQMQPSELAKFGAALGLSKFLSGLNVDIRKWKDKWKAFAIIGIPMVIVMVQGDAGSAIVFVAFALVLFRDGLESYYLITGATVTVLAVLALLVNTYWLAGSLTFLAGVIIYFSWRNKQTVKWIAVFWMMAVGFVFSVDYGFNQLKPHQQDRINVLFGKKVEKGKDWNINQSLIAIGSGGVLGKGYLQGTQTKLKFVPEQSTDFIFSSIGEEFGFLGSAIIIGLFLALFFRLLQLAERQRSKFSKIYGYCVTSILFFHFLINIGMVIGVAPVIGIPLPFISYGGSALLAFTMLLFVFVRLDTQRYEMLR